MARAQAVHCERQFHEKEERGRWPAVLFSSSLPAAAWVVRGVASHRYYDDTDWDFQGALSLVRGCIAFSLLKDGGWASTQGANGTGPWPQVVAMTSSLASLSVY